MLNAFKKPEFDRYWFETGTPAFLIRKLQKSGFRPEQFVNGVEDTEAQLKDYRTENPDPVPLFYQAGYLTISGYDRRFALYSLKFPNEEVHYGFLNSLVPYVLGEKDAQKAVEQIEAKDYAGPFHADSRKIIRVGCVFSKESRNIVSWKSG